MKAIVHNPFYDWDGRKYMEFLIENKVVRVKIPWRYGRVMCRVEGLKTVQELKKGEQIQIEIQKKVWDGIEYLILISVKECSHEMDT
jgi:hypothetical protein